MTSPVKSLSVREDNDVGRQNMETLMENLKNNINHNPEDDVYVFNEYTQVYMFNKSLIKMKSISHVRGGPLEK